MLEQGRTAIPGHAIAALRDIVPAHGRDRNTGDGIELDLVRKFSILALDGVEHLPRVVDQIHFVDGEHHMADAQQRHQVAVAPRLRQHSLARVDQNDGKIRRRGARHHVAVYCS